MAKVSQSTVKHVRAYSWKEYAILMHRYHFHYFGPFPRCNLIAVVLLKTKYSKFLVKISWFVGERDFEERQSIYIVVTLQGFPR